MNETLKNLAEASDWKIPDEHLQEIASIYAGTMEDSRAVRELDLGFTAPATLYKAAE